MIVYAYGTVGGLRSDGVRDVSPPERRGPPLTVGALGSALALDLRCRRPFQRPGPAPVTEPYSGDKSKHNVVQGGENARLASEV